MTFRARTAALAAGVLLCGSALSAQVPADSVARRQQRTIDSLATVLRRLQARIDSLAGARVRGDTSGADELAALRAAAAATSADSASAAARPAATTGQGQRLGQNALNPEISVTGDFRANAYHPGPQAGTFTAREFEVAFQSALDPFTTAKVFAAFEDGEARIEEGYFFFPALPGGFRADIGRFRQDIGELNRWHLHALPEDEYPLVLRRYGSDEGISGTGISLYRALPFSGSAGTYELTLQATTGDNEALYFGGNRLALSGKLNGFWQLSRSTYLMASASGATGSNPDSLLKTRLMVGAARFTWRPPQRAQSRELTVRGEYWRVQRRINGAGPWRTGWYADATWKLGRRFIAGARYDNVQSLVTPRTEWAVTPSLTFWQSEFVFLRGQYEYSRDAFDVPLDRFTIQAVFAMGPHKHETF